MTSTPIETPAAAPGHAAAPVPALEARGLTVGYGERAVLRDLHCAIPQGQVTAIVGANASGKSTLLRALSRIVEPSAGELLLHGEPLAGIGRRELARRLGFLPQSPITPDGLTVRDLVERGRFPHRRLGRPLSAADHERIDWALAATGTAELAGRSLDTLSGGQRQRAWIAMALAQDTGVLMLDEPTTYLDLRHQLEVLELLRELNQQAGRTIVVVLHDLAQAARYSDHLIGVAGGVVHRAGPPAELVDADFVRAVLGVEAVVVPDPVTGTPMPVPVGSAG